MFKIGEKWALSIPKALSSGAVVRYQRLKSPMLTTSEASKFYKKRKGFMGKSLRVFLGTELPI
jgi:hypothetical protein